MRELEEDGKITIHNLRDEERIEPKEKTKIFLFGFFTGVIFTIILL